MKPANTRWICLAVAVAATATLSACNDDVGPTVTAPPAAAAPVNFSTFAETTFEQPANSTPVNYDSINIQYDVNNDPTAFDALLMM
jgi:hypothetical protein